MIIDGPGVQDTLHSLGNDMCYETTEPLGPWYDVIDVRYILGPALLAPNFENPASTIPEDGSRSGASCFPVGSADRANREGSGSHLYYVNKYAFSFSGRPCLLKNSE
jgi:hypothetical protein